MVSYLLSLSHSRLSSPWGFVRHCVLTTSYRKCLMEDAQYLFIASNSVERKGTSMSHQGGLGKPMSSPGWHQTGLGFLCEGRSALGDENSQDYILKTVRELGKAIEEANG